LYHAISVCPLTHCVACFQYGEIEEMNVCDNMGDHLVGNVYVKVQQLYWSHFIVVRVQQLLSPFIVVNVQQLLSPFIVVKV